MIGAILGVVGAGLSTVQAIQAQKQMKMAAQAKSQAQQQLKNIKEFNPFKAVQVPTLGFNLAQQSQAQNMAQGINALQGMGAEGAGNVANLVQANNAATLDLAAQAQEAQFKRDAMQAEAQSGINQRQAERDFSLGAYNLETANQQYADAKAKRNAAIEGAVGSLGSAALSAYEGSDLYKKQNNAKNGGINWDYLFNKNNSDFALNQPLEYKVGATITNNQADALQGNKFGQINF